VAFLRKSWSRLKIDLLSLEMDYQGLYALPDCLDATDPSEERALWTVASTSGKLELLNLKEMASRTG
jgi:hypothetical protein